MEKRSLVHEYGGNKFDDRAVTLPFDDLLALIVAETVLPEPEAGSGSALRGVLLEELYAAVASFLRDCTVYDGTERENRFKLAMMKHRLPLLKELIAQLDDLAPCSPRATEI